MQRTEAREAVRSGQTAIWDMNGTTIVGGGAVNANGGPSLKAIGAV